MSRGMSRGGGGFPIIIAVLGVLILIVVGIFIYLQLKPDTSEDLSSIPTMAPTPTSTAIPTAEPTPEVTTAPPVTIPPVSEAPTADPNATATAYITAPPIGTSKTVWINVDALLIHSQANFTSTTVGKVPYGTQISGEVSGKWMNVSYEGAQGYIYLGKTSDGRACVVYSEGSLEILVVTAADEVDLVTGITGGTISGGLMTVTIDFSAGVYADDNATGALNASDFTITNGTITGIAGNTENTIHIVLTINPLVSGTDVTVTVKSQSVFNSSGQAAQSESASFTNP
ncbi:MAG: hypothetical protein AB1Z23_04930 [Eubacteriales bacterium]